MSMVMGAPEMIGAAVVMGVAETVEAAETMGAAGLGESKSLEEP